MCVKSKHFRKRKAELFDVDDSLIHYSDEYAINEDVQPLASETTAKTVMPQMPGMPKMIDNIHFRLRDDLEDTITKKSKLRIAAACFSIYAYEELKRAFRVLMICNLSLHRPPLPPTKRKNRKESFTFLE